MKKISFIVLLAAVISSCQTTKTVYDDVYEAAVAPEKIDESAGYKDYIKGNEDNYKTVVEDKQNVFGGYYQDKAAVEPFGTSGGNAGVASGYDDDCNCCDPRYNNRSNLYSFSGSSYSSNYFPSSYFNNNAYSSWGFNNNCQCCYDPFYDMHYGNMGMAMMYGYYDYWGSWHGYYPGSNGYGYYHPYDHHGLWSYYGYGNPYMNGGWYSWNGGGWYNNGFGWNNNSWYNNGYNSGNGGSGGVSEPTSPGKHFYGPRGSVATGSSNTTEYAHTVKIGEQGKVVGSETVTGEKIVQPGSGLSTFTGGTSQVSTGEKIVPAGSGLSAFGSGTHVSTGTTNASTTEKIPVTTNIVGSGGGNTTTTAVVKPDYVSPGIVNTGTTGRVASTNSGSQTHVVAGNQFSSAYNVAPSRGNATSTGSYGYDGQNTTQQSSTTSSGKYTPVINTSNTYSNENTSRSTSSERTTTSTTWNSTEPSRSSGSNTTTGHRSTTTSSSSSSGNSGSGSSTGTSRR